MKKIILTTILLVIILGLAVFAQDGQNQPVYDPQDPIGRVLPPNLYFVLDVSGSMSWLATGGSGNKDTWGLGYKPSSSDPLVHEPFASKMSIVKDAITALTSYESLKVRWALFSYTDYSSYTDNRTLDNMRDFFWNDAPPQTYPWYLYYNQIIEVDTPISRNRLKEGGRIYGGESYNDGRRKRAEIVHRYSDTRFLIRHRKRSDINAWSQDFTLGKIKYYSNKWYYVNITQVEPYFMNAKFLPGSACTSSYSTTCDKLLVELPQSSDLSDNDQWFATSTDPVFGNADEIKLWVNKEVPTIDEPMKGIVTYSGWTQPFLKEITGRGNTPIERSLSGVSRYAVGEYYVGGGGPYSWTSHPLKGIDFKTGQWKTWSPENLRDPHFNCRIHSCLLLTDGEDTCSGSTRANQQAAILHSQYDIDTYVIGFGDLPSGSIDKINALAEYGNTEEALFADNLGDLLYAINKLLGRLPSTEISGDTEPVLGYIDPETPPAGGWPAPMPGQSESETKVKLQNVVVNSTLAYSPVFKGHVRLFQALTTVSGNDKEIEFLTDFSRDSATMIWDAADKLEEDLGDDGFTRKVLTVDGNSQVDFDEGSWSRFKTPGLSALSKAEVESYIAWVRDQTIGSITYSTPAYVLPPAIDMYGLPGYMIYVEDQENRKSVVIAGANDGMLHCFDSHDGSELWAFIPPVFWEDSIPDNAFYDRDGDPSGSVKPKIYMELYAEGNPVRQGQPDVYKARIYNRRPHYYYIASSPKVMDVCDSNGNWKTLCVFGTGGRDKEYYCLDITDTENPQFMWRFNDSSVNVSEALGEAWSTPALGRFGTSNSDYPLGRFCAVFGSGFVLNPDWANPSTRGKTLYIVDMVTGQRLTSWSLSDSSSTTFGGSSPNDLATSIGNCIFGDPVLWESPSNADGLVDFIYFGDYQGRLYRSTVNLDGAVKIATQHIFTNRNGTPFYSGVYLAELTIPGAGKKTYLTFTEYGCPVDPTAPDSIPQQSPAIYLLVEENLPDATAVPATDLEETDGTDCSFNPGTSLGFFHELDKGHSFWESAPFRPAIFWNDDEQRYWLGATSYRFKTAGGSTGACDPETHTVGGGMSIAYIYNLLNGTYFNTTEVQLGSGTVFYGRASGFHKGLRGEGWIDIGTGETWGWGYSKTQDKFTTFQDPGSSDQRIAEKNPSGGMIPKKMYWREFK